MTTDTLVATPTDLPVAQRELFGHPRGLTVLFMTEMWERFSYFGMSALLILYMVEYLFLVPQTELVIGYGLVKGALESVLGPLAPQPFASQLFGIYTALAYLTPIAGGMIADRLLGQRRTVLLGAIIMCCAHFMLAFEQMFLIALCTLIVGNGLLKPNISTQVGGLYRPDDPRLDRAYSIFYTGINVGAFLAPPLCSTLAAMFGWRYGFITAGSGMLVGMAIYVTGWRVLPAGKPTRARRTDAPAPPLTAHERRAVLALLSVCVLVTFFWATFDQQYNTMILWAQFFTDRTVNLGFWRGEIPAAYFLSINPLMIFIATPVVIRLWAWQSQRGTEPSTFAKLGFGFMGVAVANLIMVVAAWQAGPTGKASAGWVVAYYAVLTFGELYLAPVGLSLISKMAPPRLLSMMMGVWLATTFPGDIFGGWLGTLWSGMAKTSFFALIAFIAAAAGAMMWILGPRIQALAEPPARA